MTASIRSVFPPPLSLSPPFLSPPSPLTLSMHTYSTMTSLGHIPRTTFSLPLMRALFAFPIKITEILTFWCRLSLFILPDLTWKLWWTLALFIFWWLGGGLTLGLYHFIEVWRYSSWRYSTMGSDDSDQLRTFQFCLLFSMALQLNVNSYS